MDDSIPPTTADPGSIAKSGVACLFAAYSYNGDPGTADSPVETFRVLVDESNCTVDAYLTRGLSPPSDFLLRLHAAELATVQQFIREFDRTAIGKRAILETSFVGVTKSEEYVSELPELAHELDVRAYDAPAPGYAILIPTRKSAEWWTLPETERIESMHAHIEPTIEYLDVVKRQLYHSTGLDDIDFLTYFETPDLLAFHELVRELQTIDEYRYTEYGNPIIVGTIHTPEDLLTALVE